MNLPRLGVFALALILSLTLTVACTTTDPYSGETRIDEGATAAVAGLAVLGAAAYAASREDDDDDDDRRRRHRHRHRSSDSDSASYSPRSGVICHTYTHRCYKNGHYSSKWTRREFY